MIAGILIGLLLAFLLMALFLFLHPVESALILSMWHKKYEVIGTLFHHAPELIPDSLMKQIEVAIKEDEGRS